MDDMGLRANVSLIFVFIFFILLVPSALSEEKHFVVRLIDSDGRLLYQGINLFAGSSGGLTDDKIGTKFELYSADKSLMYKRTVEIEINKSNNVKLPYIDEAVTLVINDESLESPINISIIAFADLCGDNICQQKENTNICSIDCKSGYQDNYCDGYIDSRCDPDCGSNEDPDCDPEPDGGNTVPVNPHVTTTTEYGNIDNAGIGTVGKKGKTIFILIIFVIFILIVLLITILYIIKSSNEKEDELGVFIKKSLDKGHGRYEIRDHLLNNGYSDSQVKNAFEQLIYQ
ncbi:MAG: hypothetical protein ABII01_03695 [Candidatus Woesearchaeota archaeon]